MALTKAEAAWISIAMRQFGIASMHQAQAVRHLAMAHLAGTGGDRDRAATEIAHVRELLQNSSDDMQKAFEYLQKITELAE